MAVCPGTAPETAVQRGGKRQNRVIMLRISLLGALFAGALVLPQSAMSANAAASFQVGLTITESCRIDSTDSEPKVSCLHASAWRVDGTTVTF